MPAWLTAVAPPLSRSRDWLGGVAAALFGLLVVHHAFGGSILPVSHTGWMLSGRLGPDPVQYWLGWTAFRQDEWRWPPGANPGWGMELASSVFYADAIPVLAFGFKALRRVVEVPQYWGLWIYACGALQGLAAWLLMGAVTRDALARFAASGLFVLQPMVLARLGGHFALGGQFLLLAGLWLCVTPGQGARRGMAWALLTGLAALVQAYLLPMVAALWAADWLARIPAQRGWPLAAEGIGVPVAGLLCLFLAGFFLLSDGLGGTWGGYGRMQLDLLAPFDAGDWGGLLPDIRTAEHPDAGNSYPGLGALAVMALGLGAWLAGPHPRPWPSRPLLAALLGLLLFAVSHCMVVGGIERLHLPLPEALVARLDALRASERFFWPVAYAALFGAAAALVRRLGSRRAGLVLAAALGLQGLDLQPGFARLQHYFVPQPPMLALDLADPFWARAARRYAAIRVVPTGMQAPNWEAVSVYAASSGLETDAVYLARVSPRAAARVNARVARVLAEGRHEPRTLYVLGDDAALARARAGMDPARDLLARFDGRWVLAPDWHVQAVAKSSAR